MIEDPRAAASPEPGGAAASGVPRRVLLVRLSHLGDVVRALPLFHALRERFPRAEIAWAVQEPWDELVAALPGLARVVRFDRLGGPAAWLRLRRELRAFDADLAVDAQGNLKSALVARLAGARRRLGYARGDWREPLGAALSTERAPPTLAVAPHALDRVAALCAALGAGGARALRRDPALSEAELERGRELWRRRVPPAGEGVVLLALSRASDVRAWPPARFAELARRLEAAGRPHVLLSGPEETREGHELARELPDSPLRAHWIGQRGLRDLAAFFAAAAEAGARLVGADSGPLHLADACGLPVVLLAGPQDPLRTGPWPVPLFDGGASPHAVVRSARPPACAPCLRRRCAHPRGPVCLGELDAERVAARLVPSAAAAG